MTSGMVSFVAASHCRLGCFSAAVRRRNVDRRRCGAVSMSLEAGDLRPAGLQRRNKKTLKLVEQQKRSVGGSAGYTREPIDGLFYPEPRPDQETTAVPNGVSSKAWLEHLYGPAPVPVREVEDDSKRTDIRLTITKDTIDATLVREDIVLANVSSTDKEMGRWRGTRSTQVIELTARIAIGRMEASEWYAARDNPDAVKAEGLFLSKVTIRGAGNIRAAMFSKVKQVLDVVRDEGYNVGCLDVDAWVRSHRVRRDRPKYEALFMDYYFDGCRDIWHFGLLDKDRQARKRQGILWDEYGMCDNMDEFMDGGVSSALAMHDTVLGDEVRTDDRNAQLEQLRLGEEEEARRKTLEDAAAEGNIDVLIELSENDPEQEDLAEEEIHAEPEDDWRTRALIHREVEIVSEADPNEDLSSNFLEIFEGDDDDVRTDILLADDDIEQKFDEAEEFVLTRMEELPGTFADRGDLVDPDAEELQDTQLTEVLQDDLDEFADYYEEEDESDRDIDMFNERRVGERPAVPEIEPINSYDEFARQFSPAEEGEEAEDATIGDDDEVYADNFIDKMQKRAETSRQRGIAHYGVVDEDDLDGDDYGTPFFGDDDVDLEDGEDSRPSPAATAPRSAATNRRRRQQFSAANRPDPQTAEEPESDPVADQEDEVNAIIERDSRRRSPQRRPQRRQQSPNHSNPNSYR